MSKKYHYVYKLTHIETNEFYYGSRSSKFHPSVDNYLGSMKTWKPDKTKLKKEIIKDDFKTRNEAMKFESEIITKHINEDLNRNYHIPSEGYHTEGMVTVKDNDGNTMSVSVNDPRYLSGELIGSTTGKIVVKDVNGNIFQTDKNDPKYISGELVGYSKGIITVKDNNGNTMSVSVDDPRFLSGELQSIHKGKVPVIDKNGRNFQVSVNDPRYLSGELKHIWIGKTHNEDARKRIGAAASKRESGKGNSQYGTMWIRNEKLNENKRIKREDFKSWESKGWIPGAKFKN